MKCTAVYKYLTTQWEPSVVLNEEIQNHLAGCTSCREEKARIEGAFALLNSMPQVEPTAEFQAGWRRRIREEAVKAETVPEKRFDWKFWLKPACSLAVLIIAAVAAVSYQSSVRSPQDKVSHLAAPYSAESSEHAVALRSVAEDKVLYELTLIDAGPKSRDVQRVIRNFRSSSEEGIVFSHKAENEEWTTFTDLTFEAAERLRKELERLGARVEVKPLP